VVEESSIDGYINNIKTSGVLERRRKMVMPYFDRIRIMDEVVLSEEWLEWLCLIFF
jgi:hypothetical protein